MAEVKHGNVTVVVDDTLKPPAQAGNLSVVEISRMPKAPHGLGLACEQAANGITTADKKFDPPRGVTADSLRTLGKRAEDIDSVIANLEVVLSILKQSNLLFDGEAWEQLRKVNDQVKAQGKHTPELLTIFEPVLRYFAKGPRKTEPEPK
ncbi:MAG TPA: hypothetical protein VGK67_39300 [Myxococcales bacterium]|jgi:hypothetical protein